MISHVIWKIIALKKSQWEINTADENWLKTMNIMKRIKTLGNDVKQVKARQGEGRSRI